MAANAFTVTDMGNQTVNVSISGFGGGASLMTSGFNTDALGSFSNLAGHGIYFSSGVNNYMSMTDQWKYSNQFVSGDIVTCYLPDANMLSIGGFPSQVSYTFKQLSTGVCNLINQAKQYIDGQNTYSFTGINKYVTIQSFSGQWYIIGNN